MTGADLIGPAAALILSLTMLTLFYSGKILPRNTVPREDYEALRAINASYADKFGQQTDAIRSLGTAIEKLAPRRSR